MEDVIFKALSDGNRLRIVAALLRQNELCACQITELIGVAGATASRHLGILQHAGLVSSRKDGRWVFYRLCRENTDIAGLLDWLTERWKTSPMVSETTEKLKKVLLQTPEDLCRSQRGEACCPPPGVGCSQYL